MKTLSMTISSSIVSVFSPSQFLSVVSLLSSLEIKTKSSSFEIKTIVLDEDYKETVGRDKERERKTSTTKEEIIVESCHRNPRGK